MRRESGVTVKDLKLKEVIPMMRRSRITFIIDVIIVICIFDEEIDEFTCIYFFIIGSMKPNYNPHHNISPHNGSHKYPSTHSQPRLSHTLNYTNSNKDIALKKDEGKDPKYIPTYSPNYGHITNSQTSPPKP